MVFCAATGPPIPRFGDEDVAICQPYAMARRRRGFDGAAMWPKGVSQAAENACTAWRNWRLVKPVSTRCRNPDSWRIEYNS
jgi:hypothetical protein